MNLTNDILVVFYSTINTVNYIYIIFSSSITNSWIPLKTERAIYIKANLEIISLYSSTNE